MYAKWAEVVFCNGAVELKISKLLDPPKPVESMEYSIYHIHLAKQNIDLTKNVISNFRAHSDIVQ